MAISCRSFRKAVRVLRGFGLGVLAAINCLNSQVFRKLAHTLQVYPPDADILHPAKYALQLFVAAPSNSIDARALVNIATLGFSAKASSLVAVDQAAKMRVIFRTSRVFRADQQKLEPMESHDELILHSFPDIIAYLERNIMATLNDTLCLAMKRSLRCSSLATCKSYQAKLLKFFHTQQPYDFAMFLTRKLSKYAPFDAQMIATRARGNFERITRTLPHFLATTYLELLVYGLSLQVRSAHNGAVCHLRKDRLDSMRHLAQCQVAWDIRKLIAGRDEEPSIGLFVQ
jgi:hypothetical protein